MKSLHTALFFAIGTVLASAGETEEPEHSYAELVQIAKNESNVDFSEISESFASEKLDADLLIELSTFEDEARSLNGQQLRLGPIAVAILDRCFVSSVGHSSLAMFYERVGEDRSAMHEKWAEQIRRHMSYGKEGTRENPYIAYTTVQAEEFLKHDGYTVIGSLYESTDASPLLLKVTANRDGQRSIDWFFDMQSAFGAYLLKTNEYENQGNLDERNRVLYLLAFRGDSAAQVSLGTSLNSSGRSQEARRWLSAAARSDNGLGHLAAARAYVDRALHGAGNQGSRFLNAAYDHYMSAINRGLEVGLYELGDLFVRGFYGDDVRSRGVEFLERGASLDDPASLFLLAKMSYQGFVVEQGFNRASDFFERAARHGDAMVRVEYFRFLSDPETGHSVNQQALDWLEEAANEQSAEAMYELGNCYARGCLDKPNYRRANSWYRKAVQTDPDNSSLVNSVAWTLSVSSNRSVRKPRYALRVMERMMTNSETARQSPQFLDTWAAAYAATGNFKRAVELQREALSIANSRDNISDEHLRAIREHLESFENREKVTKSIP
ncbi:MAG: hypothetical protein OXG24_00750 [Gammaproteobacteria bacterium]|nr:hypothetical protein [Gammaproteobacteria bacterium]